MERYWTAQGPIRQIFFYRRSLMDDGAYAADDTGAQREPEAAGTSVKDN